MCACKALSLSCGSQSAFLQHRMEREEREYGSSVSNTQYEKKRARAPWLPGRLCKHNKCSEGSSSSRRQGPLPNEQWHIKREKRERMTCMLVPQFIVNWTNSSKCKRHPWHMQHLSRPAPSRLVPSPFPSLSFPVNFSLLFFLYIIWCLSGGLFT